MSNTDNKTRIPVTRGAKGPAAKTAQVALTKLPVSWVGIDRDEMPPGSANDVTDWLGALIDNSNLRFTGAYLTGPPTDPIHDSDFTVSTKTSERHWVENIGSLRSQGWGIAFWYVGYSVKGPAIIPDIEIPASLVLNKVAAKQRGALHARHAKKIIHDLNSQCAGSVVFFDNENGEKTVTNDVQDYYHGFFDELEDGKSTPGLPAMRCGLYAHSDVAASFVKDRVDLFVWEVRLDTSTTYTENAPFADTLKLLIDPAWTQNPDSKGVGERTIHSFEVKKPSANTTDSKETWTAWPLGRQFRYYAYIKTNIPHDAGKMPKTGSLLANNVSLLHPVPRFDFDCSLVRDPSYPVAEPRIAAIPNSAAAAGSFEGIVVAGSFEARAAGGKGTPPRMKIESIENSGRNAVPTMVSVEPDAPIAVAAISGADTRYVTVRDDTCDLVAFKRDQNGGWSAIDVIIFMNVPALRRLRAIALVAYGTSDFHLFFACDDHQLYVSRSQGTGGWDPPSVIGAAPALHPFSSLAAASRSQQSVDVFALDDQGLLSTWSWSPTPGTWQRTKLDATAPQSVPSLLKASALAAVSPDPQKLFVFGIRKDLRLAYWEWTGPAGGWSAHKAPIEWSARLSPHTRLAAHSYSGGIEIVGLSDDGTLRLYSLKSTGTTWSAWSPIKYDNPAASSPNVVPPTAPLTEQAYGWNINPYGDLAITRESSGSVAYAAGVKPGYPGVLRLNLSIEGSTWEHLL